MNSMFKSAEDFLQCLNGWGYERRFPTDTEDMFKKTKCPYQEDPDVGRRLLSVVGPPPTLPPVTTVAFPTPPPSTLGQPALAPSPIPGPPGGPASTQPPVGIIPGPPGGPTSSQPPVGPINIDLFRPSSQPSSQPTSQPTSISTWCQSDFFCDDNPGSCDDNPGKFFVEGDFLLCLGFADDPDGLWCEKILMNPKTDKCNCPTVYNNCPSICKPGCRVCEDKTNTFPFENPIENTTTTCQILSDELIDSQLENICKNQPIVAFQCPGLCDATCRCRNREGFFYYDAQNPSFSCDELANRYSAPERDINYFFCSDPLVLQNCPGICDATGCECSDFPVEFEMDDSRRKISCAEVARRPVQKRNFLCQKPLVLENCPTVCGKNDCGCENFDGPITLRSGETLSCDGIADQKPDRRVRRCKNRKIADICPGVCDDSC